MKIFKQQSIIFFTIYHFNSILQQYKIYFCIIFNFTGISKRIEITIKKKKRKIFIIYSRVSRNKNYLKKKKNGISFQKIIYSIHPRVSRTIISIEKLFVPPQLEFGIRILIQTGSVETEFTTVKSFNTLPTISRNEQARAKFYVGCAEDRISEPEIIQTKNLKRGLQGKASNSSTLRHFSGNRSE